MNSNRFSIDIKKLVSSLAAEITTARDALDIPVLCVSPGNIVDLNVEESRLLLKKELEDKNIPTFFTIERAILALKRVYEYHRFVDMQ